MHVYEFMKTAASLLFVLLMAATLWANFGIGFYVGRDRSLNMESTLGVGEKVDVNTVTLRSERVVITLLPGEAPVYVSRKDWQPYFLSLGGKLFFDPGIMFDHIQFSGTFSMWQYEGIITYPQSLDPQRSAGDILNNPANPDNYIFTQSKITLNSSTLNYLGMSETPFARFMLDLILAKKTPRLLNFLQSYVGAGVSLSFSTPVLSSDLVARAVENNVSGKEITDFNQLFDQREITRVILNEMLNNLRNPVWGVNLAAGVAIRPGNSAMELFADAKYTFLLSNLDPQVNLHGSGLIIVGGVGFVF